MSSKKNGKCQKRIAKQKIAHLQYKGKDKNG